MAQAENKQSWVCKCGHYAHDHCADGCVYCKCGLDSLHASTTPTQLPPLRAMPSFYPGPRAENHETTNDRISAWWEERSREDLESVLAKLKQYGSLSFHGEAYERLVPQSVVDGEEIAIAMYIAGKVTRIIEGIANRQKPTDDTWDDIARYAMMARWVRENGSWP